MRVSEKTTENSERLGQQTRPGFEPGTSRLPVLSITTPPLVGRILYVSVCACASVNSKYQKWIVAEFPIQRVLQSEFILNEDTI